MVFTQDVVLAHGFTLAHGMSTWFHCSSWFFMYGFVEASTYLRRTALSFGMIGNEIRRLFWLNIGVISSLFLLYIALG